MPFSDQTIKCRDCGSDFVWTASEQEFYQQKGFTNPPVRCPSCRAAKKASMGGGYGGGPRQMFDVTCAKCGKATQVPFKPRGDRPVYCNDCFRSMRQA
jgi:CxxC-x17-CxxC domain-containing protein